MNRSLTCFLAAALITASHLSFAHSVASSSTLPGVGFQHSSVITTSSEAPSVKPGKSKKHKKKMNKQMKKRKRH